MWQNSQVSTDKYKKKNKKKNFYAVTKCPAIQQLLPRETWNEQQALVPLKLKKKKNAPSEKVFTEK